MFRKSLIINKTVILAFLLVSAVFLANCGGNTSSSSSGGSSGGGGGTKATTTTAVVPSTPSLEPLDDTGISNDSITSMNTGMHFIGTATAGDSVEILIDGSSTIPATTGTTNGTGYWSIQYTGAALTNGSHSITAKATSGTAVSAESSAFTLDIDNSPSTITNGTVASNNTVTVTFNEEVFTNILGGAIVASDFAITNFAANGGNATAISITSMTHTPGTTTATFTLNITGTPSGVETFKISNSNAVYDLAANSMAANSQFTPTLTLKDKLAPTLNPVTIASNNAAPAWATVGDTVTISFTSSEAIGTPLVDIGGAGTASSTVTNVSGNNWTASRMMVSGDTEGVVSFTINFNDLAGNAGNQVIAKTSGSSVIFDKTKPTVAIGAPSLSRVNSTGSVTYGITYTGGTTFNLTPGTVTLNTTGGATCSIGVTNGATSTPTVTLSSCTGDGTVGISLASASSDAAGNTDIGAGPSATFSVDNTAPTVAITYNQSGNTGPTFVAGPVTITATYSESVASTPNISISQQGSAAISNVAMSGSGAVYTYTYTVNTATGGTYIDGTATVTLSAINDLAGNTAAAPTNNTFVTSTIQPSVAITYNQGGNTGNSFKVGNVTITATYSENVTTVPNISIAQQGSAAISSVAMTGGAPGNIFTYTYSVNAANGSTYIDGLATISLSSVLNGTGNTALAPTNNTFTIDTAVPVYSVGVNGAVNPALTAATDTGVSTTDGITNINTGLVFSGSLGTTNAGSTIQVYVGGVLVGTATANGSGVYSVGPTGAVTSGAITFSITDPAGNLTSGISAGSITVDTTAPSTQNGVFATSTITKGSTAVTIVPTGTASDQVWFAPAGLTQFSQFIAGNTMTMTSGSATSLTSPNNAGTYVLYVIDAAGNVSPASTATLTVDTTNPSGYSVAINQAAINNANKTALSFTFTAAEVGTTYNYTITSSGGGTNVSNTGTIATATDQLTAINVTGLNDGTLTLSVTLIDSAGNIGAAATATVVKDTVIPSNQNSVLTSSSTVKGSVLVTIVSSGDATNQVWLAPAGTTVFTAGTNMTMAASGTSTSINAPSANGVYYLYIIDAAGNISTASTNSVTVDNTAPSLIANSVNIISNNPSNDALSKVGDTVTLTFTASENISTPSVSIAGNVASVSGGPLSWTATHVMASGDAPGNVPFTISFSDIAGNAGTMVTVSNGTTVLFDKTSPSISNAVLAANNGYLDITFSEGVYHTGATALLSSDLSLTFVKGTGNATGASILSVKKPDSTTSLSATDLTGGETVVRVFLTVTGTPNGNETIQIFTKNGSSVISVFDLAGNGEAITDATSVINLYTASTIQFSAASSSATEGNSDAPVNFQVTLSPANANPITLNYTISGSGANPATGNGIDFTDTNSGSITIPAGNTTYNLPVTIKGDTLNENNEQFTVSLSTGSGYMIGAPSSHTFTINDDDALPTVQFTAVSQNSPGTADVNSESNGSTMIVTAQLSTVSGRDVIVPFTLTGTATLGTDYSITSSPITIPAGSTTQTVTITILGDSIDENNETIIVTMGTATNATASGTTTHTATIIDDDNPPTVSINNVSTNEGNSGTTPFTFTATLSAASEKTITMNYGTSDGTATLANSDYVSASGALTFNPGDLSKTITVNVNGDATNETDENFTVALSALSNVTAGTSTTGTGTILNDDAATPSVSFALASSSGAESTSPTITFNLSPAPIGAITVNYTIAGSGVHPATSGTDYTSSSSVLVPGGSSTYSITVPVVNDAIDEFDENFTVTLTSGGASYNLGGQTTHVYTILDNDASPQVSFNTSSLATANESSTLNISVDLSAISGKDITVDVNDVTPGGQPVASQYAIPITDYSLTRSSGIQLIIPAGQVSANVVLTPVNDLTDETLSGTQFGENVLLTLSNPANATLGAITSHTATITDDDGQPNFSVADVSNVESGNLTVRISCVATTCAGKSVNYATSNGSASAGSDYTATSGTANTWLGSQPNYYKDVVISVTDDLLSETNETLLFTLSGNSAGTIISRSTAVATIIDNDPSLVISSAETLDCNGGQNGKIDTYRITFNEPVTDSTFSGYIANSLGNVTSAWQVLGYNNVRLIHGTAVTASGCGTDTANDNIVYLRFDEGTATDTGVLPDLTASATTVVAASGHGMLYQNTGNVASSDVNETDKAGPYIWKAEAFNTGNNNNSAKAGTGDQLVVYFTESTNALSLAGVDLDTIFTLGTGNFGAPADITSAAWSTTANANDTLTVTFATSATTVTEASTIKVVGTTLKDSAGNNPGANMISMPAIIGAFDSGEKGPVVVSAEYIDTNENGRIDHVKITFDLNILDTSIDGYVDTNTLGAANTKWFVSGYNNVRIDPTYAADIDNDKVIYFKFDEGLDYDTGAKPDLLAVASNIKDNDGINQCYINETVAQCATAGTNDNGNVLTTSVNEVDSAKPVFVSVTARVGDRYIFVRFSENVWGQPGKPTCGSGGELIQDAGSSTFDFAYTSTNGFVTSVESVDGTDNCASSDAFVKLFANVVFDSTDISADILKPYNGTAIYDAADNSMSSTHSLTIQQTIAPYVIAASSFYDNGTQYGAVGYWLRVVFSEPMSYLQAVTASNYSLAVQTPKTCTTIVGVPLSVRSVSTTVYDLQTDAQCSDTEYKATASKNIYDANEIEPVGTPNVATAFGTAATDITKPKLLQALSLDSLSAQITYSEPMTAAGATNVANYTITPSLGNITSVSATSDPSVFIIHHTNNQTGTFYTITAAATIADANNNVILGVPGNQATFRGQGQVIQTIQDGPLFTNPFADGSAFSFAFGYNSKIYLGPNDTDSGAYRFEPDGANPLAISFWDTLDLLSYFHSTPAPANPNANAISFFQSAQMTDQGDAISKDFLFLVPIDSPMIKQIFFTTDIDQQLDFYNCSMGSSSSGMVGGESLAATTKNLFLGITSNGSKRPVLRSYSFNTTTKTCAQITADTYWNNNTQSIAAIGGNAGNTATTVGVDFIFVDGTTMFMGNNGGMVWATVNDTTGKPNLSTDFTAVINDTGATCTAGNVPANWCVGANRTLALNAPDKIPSGRKGMPFMVKYFDGTNTAYLLARNVTNTFAGTTRFGGELWKCTTACTNKANWSRILTTTSQGSGTGAETINNIAVSMLVVNGNNLYIGFDNEKDGARVYSSPTVPTDKNSFTEIGRVAGSTAQCTNHTALGGDSGGLGGFCYGYQLLSFTSQSKQGYKYLYMTTGCKEYTSDGSICDTNPVIGTFTAPPIRVLTQRD